MLWQMKVYSILRKKTLYERRFLLVCQIPVLFYKQYSFIPKAVKTTKMKLVFSLRRTKFLPVINLILELLEIFFDCLLGKNIAMSFPQVLDFSRNLQVPRYATLSLRSLTIMVPNGFVVSLLQYLINLEFDRLSGVDSL